MLKLTLLSLFFMLSCLFDLNQLRSEMNTSLVPVLIPAECRQTTPLIFADFFSPNGDGHNDTFVIQNIEEYPINKIHIFNRWGDKVFEAEPYLNNWDGKAYIKNDIFGNKLPDGIYFYRFEFLVGDFVTKKNGKIVLKR